MKSIPLVIALFFPVPLMAADSPPTVERQQERLTASESALKADPASDIAKKEVAVSLSLLATALSNRKGPEDIKTAITHVTRAQTIYEELMKSSPPLEGIFLSAWQNLHSLRDLLNARGHSGDQEKAFDCLIQAFAVAESGYKGDVAIADKHSDSFWMLINTCYPVIEAYEKRGVPGDIAIAYQYGIKLFNLQESALKATGSNRVKPARLAMTATRVADLAEKAQKADAKQWIEKACAIYFVQEKTPEGLSSQDKEIWAELKKKLDNPTQSDEPPAEPKAAQTQATEPQASGLVPWASKDGKTIMAHFVRLDGEVVVVQKEDGKEYKIPFARLSVESVAQARKLAETK